MHLVLQVTEELATSLEEGNARAEEIIRSAAGHALAPMHPGVQDEVLRTYYRLDVDDPGEADAILQKLRSCEGVLGVYIKPADELPG